MMRAKANVLALAILLAFFISGHGQGAPFDMALTDNMVAYWRGDEHVGTLVDSVGSSDLSFTIAQKAGAGVRFVRSNSDYATALDNSTFSTGDVDFAWAGWVNLTTIGDNRMILSKGNSAGNTAQEYSLWYRHSTTNFRFEVSNGTTVTSVEWASTPAANTWYFIYAYHDSVNNLIGIDVNNTGTPTTAAHSVGSQDSTFPLEFGSSSAAGSAFLMNGTLATWGFWKNGLPSGATLTSIYNSGNGKLFSALTSGEKTNLVAWFDFTEKYGQFVDSVAGNNLASAVRAMGMFANADSNFAYATHYQSAATHKASIADNATLSMGDVDMAIAAWVIPETVVSNTVIAAKWGSTNEYALRYITGTFQLVVRNTANTTSTVISATTHGAATAGQRYFVIAWHDATANTLNIQVNNGAVDSVSYSGGIRDGTEAFTLGQYSSSTGNWNGWIGGVAVWKGGYPDSTDRATLWNRGMGLDYPFTDDTIDSLGTLVVNTAHDVNRQNAEVYRQQAVAQVTISATTYEAACYWNQDQKLTIATRVAAGSWTEYVQASITLSGDNNHDTCVIGIDPDGYIHVSYDQHTTALLYRKSDAAIDTWTGTLTSTLSMLGTNETQVTYPMFFTNNAGKLYFVFRDGVASNGDLFLYEYDESTTTWSGAGGTTAGKFLDGKTDSLSAYWTSPPIWDADDSNLHISFMWASSTNANFYDVSYVAWNGSTGWAKADGTAQTIPIRHSNAQIVVDTANTGKNVQAGTQVYSDSAGNPHIVYSRADSTGSFQIYHTYWNGSAWSTPSQVTAGGYWIYNNELLLRDSNPGMSIDRDNNTVYVLFNGYGEGSGLHYYQANAPYTSWTKTTITTANVGVWQPNYNRVYWEANKEWQFPLTPFVYGHTSGAAFRIYEYTPTPTANTPTLGQGAVAIFFNGTLAIY